MKHQQRYHHQEVIVSVEWMNTFNRIFAYLERRRKKKHKRYLKRKQKQ